MTQFLTLDNAVKVAVRHWGIDPVLARQEFEQKCYLTNDQYKIGYRHGLDDAVKAIEKILEVEE